MRIEFLLYDFPKFTDEHSSGEYRFMLQDEKLRMAGYKSASYSALSRRWSMDEEEFTLFVLKWS